MLVVEIIHAPYGRENAYAGLSIAGAWAKAGKKVVVALHNDGVYAAKKGQIEPDKNIDLASVEGRIKEILDSGGRVIADQLCMEVRGIDEGMLIDGVEVSDGSEMVELVRSLGEGVLTF